MHASVLFNVYLLKCGIFAATLLYKLYFAFACSVQILWRYLEKRKDKLYNNVEQLQHLSEYICMYLSMCVMAFIGRALNVVLLWQRTSPWSSVLALGTTVKSTISARLWTIHRNRATAVLCSITSGPCRTLSLRPLACSPMVRDVYGLCLFRKLHVSEVIVNELGTFQFINQSNNPCQHVFFS